MASYWQKYGLTSDPFVDEGTEGTPFFPSRWHQQLDLLRHLARSSNMVLLVTGISGVGKTTFMEMLFAEIESKAGVCKVHGSNGVTPDVLQELIIRHIGMPASGSAEANFQQRFVQQIERMHQEKDEFYLVIDNAHKLPKSSLALLVDVAEWQSGEVHPLHLILFGGPQLDAMMAEITAQHLGEAMTHTIRIEPFSLEMTKDYIQHRLDQAGYEGDYPLSELHTNQIHQASNGIPAKINIIARQMLLDNDPKSSKRKPNKPVKSAPSPNRSTEARPRSEPSTSSSLATWVMFGMVAVVGIILFVVFYFRSPLPAETTQPMTAQSDNTAVSPTSAPLANGNSGAMQSDMDEDQTQTEGLNGMVASAQQPAAEPQAKATTPTATPQDNNVVSAADDSGSGMTSSMQNITSSDNSSAPGSTAITSSTPDSTPLAAQQQTPQNSQNANGQWVPLTGSQAKSASPSMVATSDAPLPLNEPLGATPTPAPNNSTSMPVAADDSSSAPPQTPAPKKVATMSHQTTKPVTKAPVAKKSIAVNTLALTSDEQALMASDASRFTLQIAAAADYGRLKEFINAAGLEGQVYYFRTLNAGNPWYVAVFGDYGNEAQARQAISKLPAAILNREHPWPRSFGNIQKAIKVKT